MDAMQVELLESESHLLSIMMNHRSLISVIGTSLDPVRIEMQYVKLFDALKRREEQHLPMHPLELVRETDIDLGTIDDIRELCLPGEEKVWPAYVQQYVDAVSKAKLLRFDMRGEISNGKSAREILDTLSGYVPCATSFQASSSSLEVVMQSVNDMEEAKKLRVAFGFPRLDDVIRARKKQLIILCARPGVGKTTMALNMANQCAKQGQKVLFFSFEQSSLELGKKLVDMNCEADNYIDGARQFLKLEHAQNIKIIEHSGMCAGDIRFHIRHEQAGIVFVDQLDCLPLAQSRERHDLLVGHNVIALKRIAIEETAVIVLLHQLRREYVKTRGDKVLPSMDDLKDSAIVEQKADKVISLFKREDGTRSLIVNKNRMGMSDVLIPLHFDGEKSFIREEN